MSDAGLSPQEPPYRPATEIQQVLDDVERFGNALDTISRDNAAEVWFERELFAKKIISPIRVGSVRDSFVPGRNHQVPIRIYTPAEPRATGGAPPPVLLYLHGGGWTLGSIATYDSIARYFANHIPAMVILADYRLAPEHPFPAALEDAQLVLEWIARNAEEVGGDPQRLAVAGDSAGGALATVAALRGRKEGLAVRFQALFYPSTNLSRTDYRSYRQYGQGYWLTSRSVEAFRSFYVPDPRNWQNPDASPLLASDADLKLMPPALVMTCGCDVLRDEGEAYASRLRENGVAVSYRLKEPMIHACLSLYNSRVYPAASRVVEMLLAEAAEAIGSAL